MIDVILLAIALSMDAFAVSIGLGTKNNQPPRLAVLAAVYFGSFQAIMPLIGYLGGKGILGWIESFTTWVACGLLILIGGKMIFESFAEGVEDEIAIITHKVMLMLALATSIDAMAAGFSLTVLDVNPLIACLIIGLTTFCFGWAGVRIGGLRGAWLESKAELLGGVILILVGIKMLLL